jgi:hypothetical protein
MFDFLLEPFSFRRTPAVLTVSELATLGPVREPERSQVSRLMRHFLERFFNHETASPDGDAKTLLVQIACAAGLPGFLVALYLDPMYHRETPPPYWLQVNHHLFFVLYSFVAMGIAMVFEWDMFFPDLLDVQILKTLPVKDRNVFLGRVAAIAILVGGFLIDSNFLAPTIMHITLNPPHPGRFTAGHLVAVLLSGLFSAAFTLALQGSLLSLLGERVFRRLSLALQGLLIALLVMILLLFPSLSGLLPVLLESHSFYAYCFPPLWFLGIYQCIIEGADVPAIFTTLAAIGLIATGAAVALTMLTYPIAYMRRVRQVIEGPGKQYNGRSRTGPLARWLGGLFDRAFLRRPGRRAVHSFISQTLFRVPRYRIYLVLYCGVGLSIVVSTLFNFRVVHQHILLDVPADGVRASIAIVGLWTIAGLRVALASSGNRIGSWVFQLVLGRPPVLSSALELSESAQVWVVKWSAIVTMSAILLLHEIAPPALGALPAMTAQCVVGLGLCILLTDIFFLKFTRIALAGERPRERSSVAFAVVLYFTLFPAVVAASVGAQLWMEGGIARACFAVAAIAAAHAGLRWIHGTVMQDYCDCPALEDGEEDFPVRLGLRY